MSGDATEQVYVVRVTFFKLIHCKFASKARCSSDC